uniref:Receptor-like serine/threonine-protein kinase n=1 Tax=Quercus lobata TaxID=97700 RepID=A0A7N2N7X9_QUELO
MGISCWVCCGFLLYLALFLTPFPILMTAQLYRHQIANSSTSWTNSPSTRDSLKLGDGSFLKMIYPSISNYDLEAGYVDSDCGCGFIYNRTSNSSLFAIFVDYIYWNINSTYELVSPEILWSANPKNPVSINATLKFTSERGLVLQDANGTEVWSTDISGKSVAGLNFTEYNLMLLDDNQAIIWQSFDHPTDTLVLGQKLMRQQQLTSEGGLFSISLTSHGLFAYVNSNPPQPYFYYEIDNLYNISYVQFLNQSLAFFEVDLLPYAIGKQLYFDSFPLSQYMRLGPDGHLRVFDAQWTQVSDVITPNIFDCGYPTFCGNYGVCTNGQCTCPGLISGLSYFKQIKERRPELGCSLVTPLSCEASKNQVLLEFENITYLPLTNYPQDVNIDRRSISLASCKLACLKDCSCKAAIFNSSNRVGSCYLQSQNFSLMSTDAKPELYFKVYIKVQNVPPRKRKHQLEIILGSSLTSFFILFLLIGTFIFLFRKKENAEAEEYYLDHVPGMPTRYSYDDLQVITDNFNKELGGGGFGTVFEGTLVDGTKVAVKRLDGFSQIKKSFLAEVETIGNTHHFNLVFQKNPEMLLDWQHRKKIIMDVGRGLTYLHEDCRQKIVHLDIKPHNILLDENFNAKVSDFGLSKLVDRDQSQVVTTMRGTPGYMAPEWLSSVITEKVDVYSFGVVLLEILCGRRNLDRSQPEEAMHLLDLFKKNIEEDRLLDLVDKYSEDMQLHGAEVVKMMRLAAWCLQNDYTKRPSMSMVVKVLEDAMNIESELDYFFLNPPLPNMRAGVDDQRVHVVDATPLLPSILSGPR